MHEWEASHQFFHGQFGLDFLHFLLLFFNFLLVVALVVLLLSLILLLFPQLHHLRRGDGAGVAQETFDGIAARDEVLEAAVVAVVVLAAAAAAVLVLL